MSGLCFCNKCNNLINLEKCQDSIKWYEYSSYSQKKIKCECGHWNTIETIEDSSFDLNYDDRYYDYSFNRSKNFNYKRVCNLYDYINTFYDYEL